MASQAPVDSIVCSHTFSFLTSTEHLGMRALTVLYAHITRTLHALVWYLMAYLPQISHSF